MEQHPTNPNDRDRNIPDLERLHPGEIDLTGVIRQDDALNDVIGDAISEIDPDGGELPEWGARPLARALANERKDPTTGALHHFAATGRMNREAMVRELAAIARDTHDPQILDWIVWLGSYVTRLPDEADSPADQNETGEDRPAPEDTSFTDIQLENATTDLHDVFKEAEARGEPIPHDDARVVAALLARNLVPSSELDRFARTGDADPAGLHQECQYIKEHFAQTDNIDTWTRHFEQHLASRSDLGRKVTPPPTENETLDHPQVQRGIREHGDAFRAYLQLPDTDPTQDYLLRTFYEFYVGSFETMEAALDELTEVKDCIAIAREVAKLWGMQDYITVDWKHLEATARQTWDVVEMGGKLHLFNK